MQIRDVRQAELTALQDIERAAGECFRDIAMPEIADDDPLPLDVLARYHEAGHAWVATDAADAPIGYLIADVVDDNFHVEQVSVHPRWARRGIGRQLLAHLADQATARGVPALTLTTFADVPWNAPYYARCGFRALDDSGLTPGLRAVRRREAEHGLDRWPRVCMRRDLSLPFEGGRKVSTASHRHPRELPEGGV
ncbi:GCN5 family N-acetyltransferase [Micromonospora qiuiae]|uniref:GCN5 family N-acetyltransferase n=1 Tax=Micromonospora qiuiae TaxID=502268 RepID=A0ABQ4JC94_9ACTN|nr:GNAT family N-acetyltransferase [Micromonospora qiuiae]GIJ27793.1 GCN5 family N-acetyltransferase [Micromonospora qiuiae]